MDLRHFPVVKEGTKDGPTSLILAGIHGNEPCGIKAFEKILPSLNIDCGTVIFEIGNPEAVKKGTRFVDLNLNRMFVSDELISSGEKKSYEYGRSREIMEFMDLADAVLDIHSGRNHGLNPFIICEERSFPIARCLGPDLICAGFAEYEPGGTDGYMYRANNVGICIECGQHEESSSEHVAYQAIMNFLGKAGHCQSVAFEKEVKVIRLFQLYKNDFDSFNFVKNFKEFEKLKKGQLIGFDGKVEVFAPKDCQIIFPVPRSSVGQECFLLAE